MEKSGDMELDARPLVFLDMDDVLCLDDVHHSGQMLKIFEKKLPDYPEMWERLVDAGAAENLRQLHAEFEPVYVISSSWATYLNREQMCEALTRTKLQFLVENLHTEWRTPRALSSSRRDEIEWWLEAHRKQSQPFIIIDDSWSGTRLAYSPLALDGHVVLCRSGFGFTKKRLKEACRQLQRQRAIGGGAPLKDSNEKGGTLI
ncbi:HAD domain-containing protein [Massilia norwichensis]|uniref:HAD domain-containing protein n=1 Tax=Massilia norwichensis TaxID=1442366 RepID=A0ABT2A9C3_9BURK|nr:HAD domain-containing protein [Massilia norwichensis]MCS0590710.1 HAD domain-containing protein [Massilia norwichensis]